MQHRCIALSLLMFQSSIYGLCRRKTNNRYIRSQLVLTFLWPLLYPTLIKCQEGTTQVPSNLIFQIFFFYSNKVGEVKLLSFVCKMQKSAFLKKQTKKNPGDSLLKNKLILPFSSSSQGHRILDCPSYLFSSCFLVRLWEIHFFFLHCFCFLRRVIFCFQIFHFQLTNIISSSIYILYKRQSDALGFLVVQP